MKKGRPARFRDDPARASRILFAGEIRRERVKPARDMVRLVLRDGPLPVEVRQLAHTAVAALEDLAARV